MQRVIIKTRQKHVCWQIRGKSQAKIFAKWALRVPHSACVIWVTFMASPVGLLSGSSGFHVGPQSKKMGGTVLLCRLLRSIGHGRIGVEQILLNLGPQYLTLGDAAHFQRTAAGWESRDPASCVRRAESPTGRTLS